MVCGFSKENYTLWHSDSKDQIEKLSNKKLNCMAVK